MRIEHFMYRDERGVQQERTSGKSKRAARTVPLIPQLAQLLQRHIAINRLGPDDLVFRGEHGGMMNENYFRSRIFRPLCIAIGKPHARVYNLRHSCSSLLLESGANDETRGAILGHSPGAT